MLRFILLALLLGASLLGILAWGINQSWWTFPSFATETTIFLLVVHVAGYHFVTRQWKQHPTDFVKIYLGLTVLRILFFGIFVFLVIWLDAAGSTSNALYFLVSYFLFTILEVVALYRVVNGEKPTKSGQKGL